MKKALCWKCRYGHLSPESAVRCVYPGCDAELYMDSQASIVEVDADSPELSWLSHPSEKLPSVPAPNAQSAADELPEIPRSGPQRKMSLPRMLFTATLYVVLASAVFAAAYLGVSYREALRELDSVSGEYRDAREELRETKQELDSALTELEEARNHLSQSAAELQPLEVQAEELQRLRDFLRETASAGGYGSEEFYADRKIVIAPRNSGLKTFHYYCLLEDAVVSWSCPGLKGRVSLMRYGDAEEGECSIQTNDAPVGEYKIMFTNDKKSELQFFVSVVITEA